MYEYLLKENVTLIINNQSLLIEPYSHTLSLCVIHMYTYFIFLAYILLFYIQGRLL